MRALLDISILKTLRFNLHYFGIKGFRLPVLVSKNVMLKNLRGGEKFSPIKRRMYGLALSAPEFAIPDIKEEYGMWVGRSA